jgi:hypothetical protein
MDKDTERSVRAGILVGCLAVAAILCVGLLQNGWLLDAKSDFPWSNALGRLFSPVSLMSGAVVLFLLIPFSHLAYMVSAGTMSTPMLAAIIYERIEFQSDHNLIGLELIVLAIGIALVHLPSVGIMVVWKLRKRHLSR